MQIFCNYFYTVQLSEFSVFLTIGDLVHISSDLPQHTHRHIVFRGCFQDELGVGGPALDFLAEARPSRPDPRARF
jgi:hypothetical protein